MWNERKDDPVTAALLHITMTMLNRIFAKVEPKKSHWVWVGSESTNNSSRTPMIKFGDSPVAVRRVLAIGMGRHPGGKSRLVVTCNCTKPSCVAPGCVVVTTRSSAIKKGFAKMPPAQRDAWIERKRFTALKSPRTRLTPALVAQIRAEPDTVTSESIAQRLGVHHTTVGKARSGQYWAGVPMVATPDPLSLIAAALTKC